MWASNYAFYDEHRVRALLNGNRKENRIMNDILSDTDKRLNMKKFFRKNRKTLA